MFQQPVSGPGHRRSLIDSDNHVQTNVVAPQCNTPPKEPKRVRKGSLLLAATGSGHAKATRVRAEIVPHISASH